MVSFFDEPKAASPFVGSMSSRGFITLFLMVVALGLLCRLTVIAIFGNIDPDDNKLWEYAEIARNYVELGRMARIIEFDDGERLVYASGYMPPAHTFLWIALFSLFGVTSTAVLGMLVLNLVFSMGIVVMTGLIAQRIFANRLVTFLATAIIAGYPTFVFSVITYHALQIYIFLLLAGMWLMLDLIERPRLSTTAILGIVGGAATLWRVEYMMLFAALMIFAFWRHRDFKIFAVSVVCAALVIIPWTMRNYVVHERFIPIANSTGYNVWKGFNPYSKGSGNEVEASGRRDQVEARLTENLPRDDHYESHVQDVFMAEAMNFIREDPVRAFVELPVRKVLLFWTFDVYDKLTTRAVYLIAFIPTFIFTILGIIMVARRPPIPDGVWAMFAVFIAQTIVTMAYAVHARYRMNVEPFLFILAAYAAADLIDRWLTRNRQTKTS